MCFDEKKRIICDICFLRIGKKKIRREKISKDDYNIYKTLTNSNFFLSYFHYLFINFFLIN